MCFHKRSMAMFSCSEPDPLSESSPSPARVFGFGSAALDFRIRTAELGPGYTDKLLAQQVEVLGGGSASNCLVQIARLGGRAVWLGKLATDGIGARILEDLRTEGVDCRLVIRDSAGFSPFNVAVYAGQQRRRAGGFLLPGSLKLIRPEEIARWAECFETGDWLLVEIGEIPLSAAQALVRAARQRGARIAIDVDLDPIVQCQATTEELHALFGLADLLAPNAQALDSLYADMGPEELALRMAQDFQTTSVVTAGAEGAFYCCHEGPVRHQAAWPTDVVDTVGAGDAFHGGLLYGCATGRSLEESVQLAARCGAEACRREGARTGMPTAEQLGIG